MSRGRTPARLDRAIAIPFVLVALIWGSTWYVIRDQMGRSRRRAGRSTYRFALAAPAMSVVARWSCASLRLDRGGLQVALAIGLTQFCVNFNFVYRAERT